MPWITLSLLAIGTLAAVTNLESRRLEAHFPACRRLCRGRRRPSAL